jgi:hypothetical protein
VYRRPTAPSLIAEEVQPIVCVPFEFVTPASMADDIGRN